MAAALRASLALCLLAAPAAGVALRTVSAPVAAKATNVTKAPAPAAHVAPANATKAPVPAAQAAPADERQEAERLRTKLESVASALSAMLGPSGSLSHMEAGASVAAFVARLRAVVNETRGTKDPKAALGKLLEAQAGLRSLRANMTAQQEHLAEAGQAEDQSLLLGVLMTRQSEPMEKQLEVLRSAAFRKLPVVASVLAANDTKTPLFQQVAAWLDGRGGKAAAPAAPAGAAPVQMPKKLKVGKDGKPDVGPVVGALQEQLRRLEQGQRRRASIHATIAKKLAAAVQLEKKKSPKAAKQVRLMLRAENRRYEKQMAETRSDLSSLRAAIEAVKKGDVHALMRTRDALAASMKAMQAQGGGFLYLVQLAHRTEGLDCPYCAAQCVGKCHDAGKPYTACLTECADAGK